MNEFNDKYCSSSHRKFFHFNKTFKMAEMSGVFAINKPSGISSSKFLAQVQDIFTNSPNFSGYLSTLQGEKVKELQKSGQKASRRKLRSVLKVKMGHGGTLDPLASGILVVGVNKGTKLLQNYLTGSIKTYETQAVIGMCTTTGDVEGEIISKNGVKHITQDMINEIPKKFIGELKQTPPIYAALKMNGKPLYEYARENKPLPKEIKPRIVNIYSLDILSELKCEPYEKLNESKDLNIPTLNEDKLYYSKEYKPDGEAVEVLLKPFDTDELPSFKFKTQVSSGTYIRSLISDIGKSLESSAYMVALKRSQQAEWELGKNVFEMEDLKRKDQVWGKVLSQVFANSDVDVAKLFEEAEEEFKVEPSTVGPEEDNEAEPQNKKRKTVASHN